MSNQARREAARREVFRAAMELFRAKGFRATSIEEIASAAGVSQRTLFRYFPSKADIAFVPAWENHQLLCQSVRSRPPEESLFVAAQTATLEHAKVLESRPEGILEITEMSRSNPALDQRRSYLLHAEFPEGVAKELAVREGIDEPHPMHVVAARLIMSLISLGVDRWVEDQSRGLRTHVRSLIRSMNEEFRAVT